LPRVQSAGSASTDKTVLDKSSPRCGKLAHENLGVGKILLENKPKRYWRASITQSVAAVEGLRS
jgi:hypothetical protein